MLEFNGTTGESFGLDTIDLVVRGDTGATPDAVPLIGQGGHEYSMIGATALPIRSLGVAP